MAELPTSVLPGWRPDPAIAAWADKHGFDPSTVYTDVQLRALSRRHPNPAGLYLWEGAEHAVYVGISNDSVTKRLRTHAVNHAAANPQAFRFRPHPGDRATLRDLERDLIHDAVRAGFTVFNREHSATIVGASVFDDVVTVAEQDAWLSHPAQTTLLATLEVPNLDLQRQGSNRPFDAFNRRPDAEPIIEAITSYLVHCVPYPARTVSGFWSVSCLPAMRLKSGVKRIITLNMAMLEMLCIDDDRDVTRVSMGTDYEFLPAPETEHRLGLLGASLSEHSHRSGGPNEQIVTFDSVPTFIDAMQSSPELCAAGARFALDRMRMSSLSGRYRDAHNNVLAHRVLQHIGRGSTSQ